MLGGGGGTVFNLKVVALLPVTLCLGATGARAVTAFIRLIVGARTLVRSGGWVSCFLIGAVYQPILLE